MESLALLVGETFDAAGVGRMVVLPTGAAAFIVIDASAGVVTVVVSKESQPPSIDTRLARFCKLESGNTTLALSCQAM